jgi:hypothetical protein
MKIKLEKFEDHLNQEILVKDLAANLERNDPINSLNNQRPNNNVPNNNTNDQSQHRPKRRNLSHVERL